MGAGWGKGGIEKGECEERETGTSEPGMNGMSMGNGRGVPVSIVRSEVKAGK